MNYLTLTLTIVLGVISTRAPRNPEGKLLNMKEATITRSVYP